MSERVGLTGRHLRRLFPSISARRRSTSRSRAACTSRRNCSTKRPSRVNRSRSRRASAAFAASTVKCGAPSANADGAASTRAGARQRRPRVLSVPPVVSPALRLAGNARVSSARATPGRRIGRARSLLASPSRSMARTAPSMSQQVPNGSAAASSTSNSLIPERLLSIVERVRRMFDLGADPILIGEYLRSDPWLGVGCSQASRDANARRVGRIRACGESHSRSADLRSRGDDHGRTNARSDAESGRPNTLADADIEAIGVAVGPRAHAIRALAREAVSGAISFAPSADRAATMSALKAIPGIGDWTAEYIAMRALGEPDAFPHGDLVLRRMAGDCSARELEKRSEAWRPWRAYAVMLLWQAAVDASAASTGPGPLAESATVASAEDAETPQTRPSRRTRNAPAHPNRSRRDQSRGIDHRSGRVSATGIARPINSTRGKHDR